MDARSLALAVLLPGFTGTELPGWLGERLEEGLGGVCLFGANVEDAAQVRRLTDAVHAARPAAVVASDEEGGSVTRLDTHTGSVWPGHATLGALDDVDATRQVAAALGAQCASAGLDLVLAPVLDVNSGPDNPVIGVRAFGATPDLVARHGAAFVTGLQSAGVAACAKHFPGHGATRTDSHVGLPVLDVDEATWRARDLPPFTAAVEAGVRAVMTAHVVVRSLAEEPATLSRVVLDRLRDEVGFTGAIVSDAVDMQAIAATVGRGEGAVLALAAGVNLVCIGNPDFPHGYDDRSAVEEVAGAIVGALEDGRLDPARLEDAAAKVAGLSGRRTTPSPVDEALGARVAARALRVQGDVGLPRDAVVLAPEPEFGFAAGRSDSVLLQALAGRRPSWPVLTVASADESARVAAAAVAEGLDVLLVVEGRDPRPELVEAVLAQAPTAVVVRTGLPQAHEPARRSVHTFGTGRATAEATVDLLLGEAP